MTQVVDRGGRLGTFAELLANGGGMDGGAQYGAGIALGRRAAISPGLWAATQGTIPPGAERLRQILKNPILLESCHLQGELDAAIAALIYHRNNRRLNHQHQSA